jgi:large subunit ribosomal protein L23
MNDERLMKILIAPHVSEKSARVADASNQVVFRVLPDACKPEIKRAVEKLFNVEVEHVRTLSVKGKRKMFQRTPGKRSDWKKAYVRLKPGHDIDFIGGE